MGDTLATRMGGLVERHFEGSVNAAAKAYGVPQPTLRRIVQGQSESPRVGTLKRIADFHSTTIDWLMSGEGAAPEELDLPHRERREWADVLDDLDLPDEIRRAVECLPRSIHFAAFALCSQGFSPRDLPTKFPFATAFTEAQWKAKALEFQAWTVLLRGLIASYGPKAVAKKLTSELNLVRFGFQPFASFLLHEGIIRSDLDTVYPRHVIMTGKISTMILRLPKGSPALPSLELAHQQREAEREDKKRLAARRNS